MVGREVGVAKDWLATIAETEGEGGRGCERPGEPGETNGLALAGQGTSSRLNRNSGFHTRDNPQT